MRIPAPFLFLKEHNKKANELLCTEEVEIYSACSRIFSIVTLVVVMIFAVLITIALPFFNVRYLSVYAASFVISLLLFMGFRKTRKNGGKRVLPLMYALALFLYAFSILVSIASTTKESHAATVFICLQVIFPLLLFDRSLHVDVLVLAAYLLHTVLAYRFKSFSDFTLDAVNGGAFTVVGIIIGEYERYIRLTNFEKDRTLVYQKSTDMLTSLPNRRSLFERMIDIKENNAHLAGLFMIDIDHFKQFNDTQGHVAGDMCLQQLGACFARWGSENGFTFYRYGGEEFTALTESDSLEKLREHAESLRKTVEALAIPFAQNAAGVVTISIGYAPHFYSQSYEDTIKQADAALYEAKNSGRNCIYGSR